MGTTTRAAKRQKGSTPSQRLQDVTVTEEQALAALDARRQSILEHAATVSTATLLGWLQQDLGLPNDAALQLHRRVIKQHALQLLEEQGQVPQGAAPPLAADLPVEILLGVLRHLDHDSLFCALQACRAWAAAGSAAGAQELWEEQCKRLGWAAPGGHPDQQLQQAQHLEAPQEDPQPPAAAGIDWRERYQQQYCRCCYDCFRPTERRTLAVGALRLRLCHACSDSYANPRPCHRLVAAAAAKRQYCLKDAELEALPRCVEPNPVNTSFAPMHLFRRLEVRRLAVARWGTWEAVQAEHRRRITRS